MKKILSAVFGKWANLAPWKNLVFISLAFWGAHIFLRFLLLFRNNPYGFPFVSKPDWYIFHGICLDFLWIGKAFAVFALIAVLGGLAKSKHSKSLSTGKLCTKLYAVFHSVILLITLLDNEVQRFLGSHLSFGLANTYKDTSSIAMFYDYVANDLSVPFLQFVVLALILPATYGLYRLIRKGLAPRSFKIPLIALCIFYLGSYLFVYVIWTGNARMAKLRPVVTLIYNELFPEKKLEHLNSDDILILGKAYQNLWQKIEGDSLWIFDSSEVGRKLPLYLIPQKSLLESEALKARRAEKPNFILFLLESHRGLNVGFMNP
ncbi:MAG: hypothetical protein J6Z31_08380, partial [Fibrobacter sp.]|nr:hypothetical protein [Fibrobacter sp.]